MKVFATFYEDGDGESQIYRIGLNLKAFELNKRHTNLGYYHCRESSVYFQEINEETELTSPNIDSWKPYNGEICIDNGWLINDEFYSECDDDYPDDFNDEYNFDDHGPRVCKYEIYKEGNLIDTVYKKEDW